MDPAYTSAQIASALGKSKRAIQLALQDVSTTSLQPAPGQPAKAWSIGALPASIRQDLERVASGRGYRDAAALLAAPPIRWEPPVPVNQVSANHIEEAVKRRDAFLPSLTAQHHTPPGQLLEEGRAAYARVFGHPISERHWRRIFDRAVQRDCGRESWHEVALYLDDAAFRKREPVAVSTIHVPSLSGPLDEIVETVVNKADLGSDDRNWVFDSAFRLYEEIMARPDAPKPSTLKKAIVEGLLARMPSLSKTPKALVRVFEIKLSKWQEGGRTPAAVEDGRWRSGNVRPEFKADEAKIRDLAILHDGNEALAHRKLRESNALSPEFCERYKFDPRTRKSYVPHSVRSQITPTVEAAVPLRRSGRQQLLDGPITRRDWNGVEPGDYFTADDVTWNHYFKVRDQSGMWDVSRGECLLMTDLKCDYPVEFVLIAGKYNGEHIRRLMARAHDKVGLPRRGFVFERGVWRSRLVVSAGNELPWRETERSWRNLRPNFEIHHTYTPRGKTIEGCIGMVQDRMRCLPGFVGFDEAEEKRERIQKLIARARRGDEEALSFFPTQDQWVATISGVLEEFKNDPQNGKRIGGVSPAEAWNQSLHRSPLPKLTPEQRYLLATHCIPTVVNPNRGIVLTIRGTRRCYANDETGRRYGQKVLAFYNAECPELLTVSDQQRRNFFTVKELVAPAMSASRAELLEISAAKKAHMAPARVVFGQLDHAVVSNIERSDAVDQKAQDLGRFHNEAVARHVESESSEDREVSNLRRRAARLGEDIDHLDLSNPRHRRGIERMLRARELESKQEPGTSPKL